jgi:hypothetical protein
MAGISNESFINAYIAPLHQGLQAASIEYFLKTGTVNGSFSLALNNMLDAVREDERNRIHLEEISKK